MVLNVALSDTLVHTPFEGGCTMKKQHAFLNILMLLPLLLFSLAASAQPSKAPRQDSSVKEPEQGLSASFSSTREGKAAGSVYGELLNKSSNTYPCVRIEFDLYTRFDLRPPGEKSRHLGVLTVEVQDVSPHTVRKYEQRLPYPAGIGLKAISQCSKPRVKKLPPGAPDILSFTATPQSIRAGQRATLQWSTVNADEVLVGKENPEWRRNSSAEPILLPRGVESSGTLQVSPLQTTTYRLKALKGTVFSVLGAVTVEVIKPPEPAGTCSISGRVSGKLKWKTMDDRGERGTATLTQMAITTPSSRTTRASIQEGNYTFANLPAGKTYTIFPYGYFRSEPRERTVLCEPNTTHRGENFSITGPPLID
jgi:hypothetical protein